jgi:hypothetical protein
MPVHKNQLRAKRNFGKLRDGHLLFRGRFVYSGMSQNVSKFPRPTVPLNELKSKLDRFEALRTEASFRDTRAVAEKNSLRSQIVQDLNLLASYVEYVAGDLDQKDVFISSGFELATDSYTGPQPLDTPKVQKLTHGKSGELLAKITNVGREASRYDIRRGVNETDPETWPITSVVSVAKPVLFTELMPGTVYAFQARAFGRLGFTDWSDSATLMCI